jgi:hypothetical protein
MKANPPCVTSARNRSNRFASSIIAAMVALSPSSVLPADIPDSSKGNFQGIYKVVSSSDPMFPATVDREYFLDFGKGIQAGKLSGSVAISMRQNPNVKVRILAWQYFPKQASMVIGNPYSEGSTKAVAKGVWRMTGAEKGVLFERGNYQVVLRRAKTGEY